MTLRDFIDEHPDWLDYDMVVYRSDGGYDYVGAAGAVYLSEDPDTNIPVVVFSAN
jgi:hypothetical protein